MEQSATHRSPFSRPLMLICLRCSYLFTLALSVDGGIITLSSELHIPSFPMTHISKIIHGPTIEIVWTILGYLIVNAVISAAVLHGAGERRPRRMTCNNCRTHVTPQWRCGPDGPRTLCNACGVRWPPSLDIHCLVTVGQ